MKEILDEVLRLLEEGEDFALVKLGSEQGSTPRAAGAEMLVRRDGSTAGTIGGGLLELTMVKEASNALREGRSRVTSLSLAGADLSSAEKMVCGGSADVLVTYVPAGDPELLDVCTALRATTEVPRRAWLFTIVPADAGGSVEYGLLAEDGSVVGARPCDPLELRSAVGRIGAHGSTRLADGRELLVEEFGLPATVVICGAGHVGRAVAPIALGVGFRVVVIDDREAFADPEYFPGCTVVHSAFDGSLERVAVTEHTHLVIVTHGHVHDLDVLRQALRTPACYIGLMASRSKRARIVAALREAGFNDDAIARLRSPIGIEIGAETPGELAISIVAEMIQVRAERRA